jgi:hypothetical protein
MHRSDNYELVTFTFGGKLHGQWGLKMRRSVRATLPFFLAPGCSSWFPGILSTEVDDARDSS